MAVNRITSFSDLIDYLQETGAPHHADADKQLVELPTVAPPLKSQVLIRWERRLPYVQVICPMVANVPLERRAEVEHAICRANNTIPLPGFGFEYERRFIYMRLCVPMYDEGMTAQSFGNQVKSVVSNARQFLVPFNKIVGGEAGEKILEFAAAEAAGIARS